MTDITVKGFAMFIQVMVKKTSFIMGGLGMALPACDLTLCSSHRRTSACNLMIPCLMAFSTGKVISSHVNITASGRLEQLARQVCMLYCIASAPVEMAGSAGGTACMADILGNCLEIHIFCRHAGSGRSFFVLTGCIMAYQTIYFCFVSRIKGRILTPVSCVTACATSLVACGVDSVVVYGCCPLAVQNILSMPCGIRRRAFPQPMGCFKHIFTLGFMAS